MDKKIVIYLEDEEKSKRAFTRTLKTMYGSDYEIVAISPEVDIPTMIEKFTTFSTIVSYVIDERLQHTGTSLYSGSELITCLRDIDSKIPIYILTSHAGEVEEYLGNIEFVIDKNQLSEDETILSISQRLRRHQDTFQDIQSKRASRLEVLLQKSINSELSEEERIEFKKLNILRLKPILIEEQESALELKKELDHQQQIIDDIERQLGDFA